MILTHYNSKPLHGGTLIMPIIRVLFTSNLSICPFSKLRQVRQDGIGFLLTAFIDLKRSL